MINVLFVCLGNICRSPMAEGSFKKLIHDKGLSHLIACDSAGTSSYHIGEPPDERMRQTAKKHGVKLDHAARQLSKEDFTDFDYIIAMDSKNFHNIRLLSHTITTPLHSQILMMRQFDPGHITEDVPDPYFGGLDGFEEVYDIVTRSSQNLLNHILKEKGLI